MLWLLLIPVDLVVWLWTPGEKAGAQLYFGEARGGC